MPQHDHEVPNSFGFRQERISGTDAARKIGSLSPKPSRFARGATLATSLAAFTFGASAQAPDTDIEEEALPVDPDATQMPEVLVQGQQEGYKPEAPTARSFTEPLRDVPQTITVIPETVMRDQGVTSLRDVLRNVPGISIQAGEGGGGLPGDNLSIRGFNARSDLFIDGMRDYGSYSRDPFNYEQIEVYKGPSSSVTGRGSTGGSINLVTKTPKLDPFYRGEVTGGSDNLFRGSFDINEVISQDSGTAFRLNGLFHKGDAPGRDVVEFERWGIAPSLSFGLGTDTRATLTYLRMEEDNVPDYGIPWVPANTNPLLSRYSDSTPPVSFDNFYGLRGYDFEKTETDVAGLMVEHDFSDSLSIRNFTRYARTHRDSAITAPRFVDVNNSTEIRRQLQRREITNEILANQTDLTVNFSTGMVDHTLVAGLEFAREDQDNRNSAQFDNQPTTDLFNPTPGDDPLGPMPPITGVPSTASSDTVALSLFDTMKFGSQWELTGGVRYDNVSTEWEDETSKFDRSDDMLSGRAAIVYKPVEHGSIYFGFGTSFNPSIDGNTGLTLNVSTESLDPEETETFELGTKWDLMDDRLALTAAVFRTDKTNARTTDPTDPDSVTVLKGEQRVDGLELGFAGSITDDWSVFGGYTYLDSEIVESNNATEVGNELSNTPEHSFSLWSTYSLPWNLEIGAGAQYVGDRFNNTANARVGEGYWTIDAMVKYEINENMVARLNIYNLADEEYVDRLGGGHFIPGAGRSASLSLGVSF